MPVAKPTTRNSVDDIAKFVALGNSQSPANCRVLLREINRLRRELRHANELRDAFRSVSVAVMRDNIALGARHD